MNIDKFLETNNLIYKAVWYFIEAETGRKTPIGEKNNLSQKELKDSVKTHGKKPTYTKKDGQKIYLSVNEYNSLQKVYSIYLKHTDDLYCLDVDMYHINTLDDLIEQHNEFNIFQGCSWVVGNTKGIHIYLRCTNVPYLSRELKVFKNIEGDFIHRNNCMWEKINKKVAGSIITLDFELIRPFFSDDVFNDSKTKTKTTTKTKSINTKDHVLYSQDVSNNLTQLDHDVLNLLDRKKHFENTSMWLKMCWMLKSLGFSYEVFDKMSEGLKGYNKIDNKYRWDGQKTTQNININIIHHLAKIDNQDEYEKLTAEAYFKPDEVEDDKHNLIRMSQRYLLGEDVKLINDETCLLQQNIIKFFNDDSYKSFNLKSPYDTGKTQMLKRIIDTFNPNRILWLSYRKTLTNDILGNFAEAYNFRDYQKHQYTADRLIIQLESVLKIGIDLADLNIFSDDEEQLIKYPEYDLVIIDEIEAILSHFNSPTFKGNSKACFNYIQNVLNNSKKIITLDGDIGKRTYNFIESFGKSINVVNDIQINPRHFIIDENENKFYDAIKTDLLNNNKIVVVSMSSNKCDTLEDKIKSEYGEEKKILVYTGSSGDESKEDFKNVLATWSQCDILIYSPTCESGVNFDMDYFDKMYGILSDLSTTPRSYFQMLSRVRRLKHNDILILNECFNAKSVNPNRNFFQYNEVKQSIMLLEGIKLETSDVVKEDGKIYKSSKLSLYDINYIHNRTEQLNATRNNWLSYFHKLALIKGHTIEYLINSPCPNKQKEDVTDHKADLNTNKILIDTPNINDEEYQTLLAKQKKNMATKEDKLKIKKHVYKHNLGLDELNEDVLKAFDLNTVSNFVSLIDIKNIKDHDDNQTLEAINKAEMVTKLINDMGFNNIFDTTAYDRETFLKMAENVIKNNQMFVNMNNTRIRFNLNKDAHYNNNKAFLGLVNTIFKRYGLKIESFKKTINKVCNIPYYRLQQLNCINELVEYKLLRGHKIYDSNNIRPKSKTDQYKSLVNFEQLQMKIKHEDKSYMLDL